MNAILIAAIALTLVSMDAPTGRKELFITQMTDRLLAGQGVPPDLESQLMVLEPAERFEVVVFLRRSGLLTGAPLSVDRLLDTPAGSSPQEQE